MRTGRTIYQLWRQFRRRVRVARARLRRDRAMAALVALLMFGLGEPLLCILHCQVVLPIAFHDYLAAQIHHEHHAHMHPAASPSNSNAGATAASITVASAPFGAAACVIRDGSSDGSVPFHVPPSPIHDMILVLIVVLPALPLIQAGFVATPRDPPGVFLPPPLRPPILLAA